MSKPAERTAWFLALFALGLGTALPAKGEYLAFTKEVLPNGLTLILHEDRSIPVVAVNTWVKVGAADEKAGETGRAHLFKHFMFEGSAHVPQGGFDSAVYAMGGTNNAWTGFDETNYFTLVPSNGLGEALRLESDRLGYLRGAINPEALNKQIGIVINELAERRDGPYADAGPESARLLWPQGHPGRNSPGGDPEDVRSTRAGDAAAFHRKFYNPNNVILVIAGDFDSAATAAEVRRWYGSIPAGSAPPARSFPPFAKLAAGANKTLTDPKAVREALFLSFRIPDLGDPDHETLSLLAGLLEGNDAWGLTKTLTVDRELALGISAGASQREKANEFSIRAVPAAGVPTERLKAEILAHIRATAAAGFPASALPAVKASLRSAILGMIQTVSDRATILARGEAHFGDPAHFEQALRRMIATTEDDLKRVAAEYLTEDNLVTVSVVPGAPGRGSAGR